jgi:hypothetical protein
MKSFGHGQQSPAPDDETSPVVFIGFDQAGFETEALCKFQGLRFFGYERIRAAFKEKTIALPGLNDAAKLSARFEKRYLNLFGTLLFALDNSMRRSQTRDATANDYDAFHLNVRSAKWYLFATD